METEKLQAYYKDQPAQKSGSVGSGGTPSANTTPSSNTYGGGTSAPDWSSGWYRNWYTGSPDYVNEPMNQYAANQGWWRGPDVAGGLLYNDYYGYQKADDVRNFYLQHGRPVSNAEFVGDNWFVNKNTGQDWRQYFPDLDTDAGWQSKGYEWDPDSQQWVQGGSSGGNWAGTVGGTTGEYGNYVGDSVMTDVGGGNMANTGSYPMAWSPSQWGQSSDIYSYFGAPGSQTMAPQTWDTATGLANYMGMTGDQADTNPAYLAAKNQAQYEIGDAIKQANEQAGLAGSRWSSIAQRNAQDIGSRRMADLQNQWAQQSLSAAENAANRKQQAISQLYNLGQGTAGLTESAKDRAMSAAGGLGNIGSLYAQYPLQVAGQAQSQGQDLYGQEKGGIDAYKNEFMRMAAENNPWLGYIYQMATGQGVPQQYTQGIGSGLMGLLSGIFG